MLADLEYFARLFRSLWRSDARSGRATAYAPAVVLGAVALMVLYGYVPAVSALEAARTTTTQALLSRAAHVGDRLRQAEGFYEDEAAPLERVLRTYRNDPQLTRRVAVALVREGRRTNVNPRLLTAVLLVENPWLETGAKSPVGAQGLMQVMPLHRGKWKPCAPRLDDVDANICHGARIFASYVREEGGNMERALLRYNGCVNGTNTPNCHQYARVVFARAGHIALSARRQRAGVGAAASP